MLAVATLVTAGVAHFYGLTRARRGDECASLYFAGHPIIAAPYTLGTHFTFASISYSLSIASILLYN